MGRRSIPRNRKTDGFGRSPDSQGEPVFQLKITLKRSRPAIWRRVLVPASIPLDWLHLVIQRAMGWGNHHLHDFFIDGIHYGDSSIDNVLGFEEETKYALSDLMKEPGAKFVYEYDFGDDWEHELILEKILRMDADLRYPVCVKGANACPPEDCGGIWSYYQKLKALKDPSDPQSAEIREWFGYDFDPAEFSLKAINRDLGELAPPHRPKKRMRR